MNMTKKLIAITALIMSAYFWYMRFDIITRIFNRGSEAADIGELILPLLLLIFGIILLRYKPKTNNE